MEEWQFKPFLSGWFSNPIDIPWQRRCLPLCYSETVVTPFGLFWTVLTNHKMRPCWPPNPGKGSNRLIKHSHLRRFFSWCMFQIKIFIFLNYFVIANYKILPKLILILTLIYSNICKFKIKKNNIWFPDRLSCQNSNTLQKLFN